MRYSEFLRQYNIGAVVKGSNVLSLGSDSDHHRRVALVASYTGTLTHDGHIIGVRPLAHAKNDRLEMSLVCQVVSRTKDGLIGIKPSLLNPQQTSALQFVHAAINSSVAEDRDLEEVLAGFGFVHLEGNG